MNCNLRKKAGLFIFVLLIVIFNTCEAKNIIPVSPVYDCPIPENFYQTAIYFCRAAYEDCDSYRTALECAGWENIKFQTFDGKEMESIIQSIVNNDDIEYMKDYESLSERIERGEIKDKNICDLYKKYKSLSCKLEQHFGYAIGTYKLPEGNNLYAISYRGTDDAYSWIFTDFRACSTEFLDTKTRVHSGFEHNRQACMKQSMLNDFVEEIKQDPNSKVLLTGHSLGAAVAVLQAAYLIEENIVKPENLILITFAEPCPGRRKFVKRYTERLSKNYTWFVNKKDVVPELPELVRYKHFSKKEKASFKGPGHRWQIGGEPHWLKTYEDFIMKTNSTTPVKEM